ncbi:MAG: hypothetical protein QF473_00170, partial [Planctomycetota bacterium]|nr:hypothetical protein [Planctomycetota bacterium]
MSKCEGGVRFLLCATEGMGYWMLVIEYQHRSVLIQILDAGYWMLGYAVQARNDRCGVQLKPRS